MQLTVKISVPTSSTTQKTRHDAEQEIKCKVRDYIELCESNAPVDKEPLWTYLKRVFERIDCLPVKEQTECQREIATQLKQFFREHGNSRATGDAIVQGIDGADFFKYDV